MADAYTSTASVTYDQTAYDRMVYFALRPELYFDRVASVQPTRQNMPGASVVFNLATELAPAVAPLSEVDDIDAVAMANTQLTLTLQEYGNALITTAKLRATSMVEIDPIVANLVGYNAGISQDTLAINTITAQATNVTVAGAPLTAEIVRRQLARLRAANVPTIDGSYVAFVHPDVSFDFRAETTPGWRTPHENGSQDAIWNGEIGKFEGFRFIETPRAPVAAGVYTNLFLGGQAVAKAYSTADGNGPNPRVVMGPVVDKLRRFVPIGWYWLGGYGVFRQEAVRVVTTTSTIDVP